MIENIITRAKLNYFTGVHNAYSVRHVCHHAHIMRDKYNGKVPLLLNLFYKIKYFGLYSNIQSRGRFITDKYFRVARKRNNYNYTLAHTAGKLKRILIKTLFGFGNANGGHQFKGTLFRLFMAQLLMYTQCFGYLLANLHYRIKRRKRILKHHGYALAAYLTKLLFRKLGKIHSVIQYFTAIYYRIF